MDSGPDGTRGGMAGLEQANAARKAALFAKLFAQLGDRERTVVEIGAGTLPNARFYRGRDVDLIGLDPNDSMKPRFDANAAANGLTKSRFVHGRASAPLPPHCAREENRQ